MVLAIETHHICSASPKGSSSSLKIIVLYNGRVHHHTVMWLLCGCTGLPYRAWWDESSLCHTLSVTCTLVLRVPELWRVLANCPLAGNMVITDVPPRQEPTLWVLPARKPAEDPHVWALRSATHPMPASNQARERSLPVDTNICITFVQRRPSVFDAGPTLYKCYTNVMCLLGCSLTHNTPLLKLYNTGDVCDYICDWRH